MISPDMSSGIGVGSLGLVTSCLGGGGGVGEVEAGEGTAESVRQQSIIYNSTSN